MTPEQREQRRAEMEKAYQKQLETMTPEQIQLARAAMALPGAPVFSGIPGEYRWREFETGILWRCTGIPGENRPLAWLPNLTDAATGGVLLSLLIRNAEDGQVVWRTDLTGSDIFVHVGEKCSKYSGNLAESCCRVAIKVGRWGPA